jgi:hypothetical protein
MAAGFVAREPGSSPDVFFFVRWAARTAWFLPSGAGHLVSAAGVTAPDGSRSGPPGALDVSIMDENGHPLPDIQFRKGMAAPAHILIPNLQGLLLYGWRSDSQDSLSLAFLDLESCDPG